MKKWKITISPNKSLTYLLGVFDKYLDLKYIKLISNTYIYDENGEECFCILYKFLGKKGFIDFEGDLMNNPLFIGHKDYENYVLYKFKMNSELKKVLDLFKEGKYGEYSKEDIQSINDFLDKRGWSKTLPNLVFSRDQKLRSNLLRQHKIKEDDIELADKPSKYKETFSNVVEEINYVTVGKKFNK